jgi:hypothetical protein
VHTEPAFNEPDQSGGELNEFTVEETGTIGGEPQEIAAAPESSRMAYLSGVVAPTAAIIVAVVLWWCLN